MLTLCRVETAFFGSAYRVQTTLVQSGVLVNCWTKDLCWKNCIFWICLQSSDYSCSVRCTCELLKLKKQKVGSVWSSWNKGPFLILPTTFSFLQPGFFKNYYPCSSDYYSLVTDNLLLQTWFGAFLIITVTVCMCMCSLFKWLLLKSSPHWCHINKNYYPCSFIPPIHVCK